MSGIYRLYVRIDGVWELECAVEADDPQTAFADALLLLSPSRANLPIRFEIDT